jgi:hypothetical protein
MTPKEQAKAHYFNLVDYFTAKIKAQDYEIKRISEKTVGILIDNFFYFNLWPGDIPNGLKITEGLTRSTAVNFHFKESDKAEIWLHLDKLMKAHKRDRLIKELNEIMDVENSTK